MADVQWQTNRLGNEGMRRAFGGGARRWQNTEPRANEPGMGLAHRCGEDHDNDIFLWKLNLR